MSFDLLQGDSLEVLSGIDDNQVRCCVTSPPYWGQRDYGVDGQLGLESSPKEYIDRLVQVFDEVKRVLTPDGTLWLNLGDSYAGGGCGSRDAERWPKQSRSRGQARAIMREHAKKLSGFKTKDLIGIPWMAAFALRDAGWYLRCDIVWQKPAPMPESVRDRPTRSHEFLFLLSKSENYYFNHTAIKEPAVGKGAFRGGGDKDTAAQRRRPGRTGAASVRKDSRKNAKAQGRKGRGDRVVIGFQDRWNKADKSPTRHKRDVWTVGHEPFKGAHFAVMPTKLVEPCVLAGSQPGDIVLDPFCGSGTVGVVALRHDRNFVGIDLNSEYLKLAGKRIESSKEAA